MQANKWLLCWRLGRVGVHLLYGCAQILLFFGRASRAQRQAIIGRWSQQLLHICGMRLTVLPQDMAVDSTGGRMLVANHISWVDIPTIHAIRFCRFISKSEVKHWPVIGRLADSADTLYLQRTSRKDAHRVLHTMAERLQQGDVLAFFPEGTIVGEDADFFYFPAPADGSLGQPVLGGGTLFSDLTDNPSAMAFVEFLQTPLAHEIWMAQQGFLTPHKGVNPEAYEDPTVKRMGDVLLNATTFRFDGSDMMPGAIGAGAFWTGMVDFVGGKTAQEAADQIQSTWDTMQ